MQYQTIIFSKQLSKMAMLKNPVSLSKILFHHQTSSCISSICLLHIYNQTGYLYDNRDVTSCNLTIVSCDNYVPFFTTTLKYTTLGLDSVNFFNPEDSQEETKRFNSQ